MKSSNHHIFAFLDELLSFKPASPSAQACCSYALLSAYTGVPVGMLLTHSDIEETELWLTRRTNNREQFSVSIPFPVELRTHFDTLSISPKKTSKIKVGIQDITSFIRTLKQPGFQPVTVAELPLIFKLVCDESPAARILMKARLKLFAYEFKPSALAVPPLSANALTFLQLKSWARRKARVEQTFSVRSPDLFEIPVAPWDDTES